MPSVSGTHAPPCRMRVWNFAENIDGISRKNISADAAAALCLYAHACRTLSCRTTAIMSPCDNILSYGYRCYRRFSLEPYHCLLSINVPPPRPNLRKCRFRVPRAQPMSNVLGYAVYDQKLYYCKCYFYVIIFCGPLDGIRWIVIFKIIFVQRFTLRVKPFDWMFSLHYNRTYTNDTGTTTPWPVCVYETNKIDT